MAKSRFLLLSLLSALLLFSQHVAVAHAVWHQAHGTEGHAVAVGEQTPADEGGQASHLCDFDAMLGQLLAGGAVAQAAVLPAADATQNVSGEAPRLAALASVQPRSRGPPSYL